MRNGACDRFVPLSGCSLGIPCFPTAGELLSSHPALKEEKAIKITFQTIQWIQSQFKEPIDTPLHI